MRRSLFRIIPATHNSTQTRAFFSGGIINSNATSGKPFTVNMPSPSSTSWERSAKLVKNTDTTNQYLEHIRDVHDPSMQLKTLEDELKGTMGKALGKQGEKVLFYLRKMKDERECYVKTLEDLGLNSNLDAGLDPEYVNSMSDLQKEEVYRIVQNYNQHRKDAMKARWELLVHRQAVGFITNNHRFVHEKFPIPEPIALPDGFGNWSSSSGSSGSNHNSTNHVKEPVTRNFGTQLDWWESIGRWR